MSKSGEYPTLREIAAAERINESYVGHVLRLTLLAPDIVEAILNGRQPAKLTLDGRPAPPLPVLMKPFAIDWAIQLASFRVIILSRSLNPTTQKVAQNQPLPGQL
jgi:hypothetical protein